MTAARPFNFSAGPATLPEPVLRQVAAEMLDWGGSGMSVMEMSHRGKEFGSILERAEADLRELLAVPANFRILFMQGGGLGENAIVPMNLSRGGKVDVVVTGSWSRKSATEARRYADVRVAANIGSGRSIPGDWQLRTDASYVHLCTNETIDGIEFHELPQLGNSVPLVIDCSSHLLSRAIDWRRVGLAFGGAQKNIGPAGLTLVFVRDDLLGHALDICPTAFNFETVAANHSMYNTPPTFAIYVAGLVFKWVKNLDHAGQRGLAAIEQRNIDKARLLYAALDASSFYENRVDPSCRSRMNVPFFLRDEKLNDAFLAEAKTAGLLQLKGHKSVGGMRASLYNAMPLEGVQALVSFMKDFEARHG
ncbi:MULTISPECIES: 3-phosphoserine/phosphohydroxythreonine transaminase [unclassified Roseateles]|uniref:3-phosphoserine/phosphohydroxythreonine transaminase n=1 Tax=unclassified Roseateles TaxID=2626991 RepID=UPI0006F43986|nr:MULTISPECIES: 3-phosphoserine/phosphohydroxythreonine transaminase [unclassified Roseateles]KQW43514.1 3-phosphoserine/phosphohydroxythreonine aminotransferase [Pelomonas sp. Root405]KRA71252.1 3-phosphoserine/phosphohydroxythreonine aminotransferase [Pelomonas sp. Root662]